MTRVIHTGDTHIGYQQYNSPERRRDFLDAFRGVVEDAVAEDVDAVIHAGDLFHDRRPGLIDLQGTVDVLRQLADADIPFLAVVGNHEGKRDAQWLDLFSDLGLATRLGAEPVAVDDVAFYGLDFVPRSRREDLTYEFEPPTDAGHAVLVGHGLFEPFPHADWDTETVLSESTVDFDAVLLGDNHAADTAQVDGTWVTYCGSTERASAAERPDRGYNVVTFDEEVTIARRGIEVTREFVFVDVELSAGEGGEEVRERLREYDIDDAVVVVTIDGEGEPVSPATVEELAADRGALIARVTDRREVDADEEVDVSFADPDEAVRERIRDLGLSDAARDIDRTVRDLDAVADANVREAVERRVRDRLESDPASLVSASEDATGPTDESTADDGDGAETVDDGSEEGAPDGETEESGNEETEAHEDEETRGDETGGEEMGDEQTEETGDEGTPVGTDADATPDGEHASLGDFT